MLLRHLGWQDAADLIVSGVSKAIAEKQVTCDLAEMIGVEPLSCSDFATAVIKHM